MAFDVKAIKETIDGKEYTIGAITVPAIHRIQAAINALPRPDFKAQHIERKRQVDECVSLGIYDDKEAKREMFESVAEEKTWPPLVMEDPRATGLLMREPTVQAALLEVALGITAEEATALSATMPIAQYTKIMGAAMSIGGDDGPKRVRRRKATAEPTLARAVRLRRSL